MLNIYFEDMSMAEALEYQTRSRHCFTRECFLPSEVDGEKICYFLEKGECPDKYKEKA